MKHYYNSKGFTLIEIMIVVAIIGILVAVAYPSYQDSVQKSRRTDGKSVVVDTAALQEKWYFQQNRYTDDATDLGVTGSQEGFYTVNINQTACGDDGSCFQVVATTAGVQVNDTTCTTFTIDHTGNKTAQDNNSNDTTSICW
mgnify:CR=1 FL=1|tara:strand:- start:964 stop:1389 length:426 start_codon:yes stop_codon:yes gene_type:complete